MSLPGLPGLSGLDRKDALALLRTGRLEVQGRLEVSSNAALYCTLSAGSIAIPKPLRDELHRPGDALKVEGRRGAARAASAP